MARIRSIHPGLFTDELYMSLSMPAKAVWPGLWTEADDHGVFEWKPLSLKARLMPCESIDMAAILAEFVEKGLTINFEEGGKSYGAIKGFCKWQRPKSPTYRFPLPEIAALFVDESARHSEEVPKESPTPTPKSSQRKEEGGRMDDEGEKKDKKSAQARKKTRLSEDWQASEDQLAYAEKQGCVDPKDTAERFRLYHLKEASLHANWDSAWQYWCRNEKNFARPQSGAYGAQKNGAARTVTDDGSEWEARLRSYRPGGFWSQMWGERPEDIPEGRTPTQIPPTVLAAWRASA